MGKGRFTPGPWKLLEYGPIHDCTLLIGDNPAAPSVALICTDKYESAGDELKDGEAESNANLIAAAPEMYAALRDFVEDWAELGGKVHGSTLDKIDAAIAKAEGRDA